MECYYFLFFKGKLKGPLQYNGADTHVYIADINVSRIEIFLRKLKYLTRRLHRSKAHVSNLTWIQANFIDRNLKM